MIEEQEAACRYKVIEGGWNRFWLGVKGRISKLEEELST